jgi:hypothetical protein
MKIKINWKEPSTIRGAVWVAVAVIGTIGWFMGKDISQLTLLGAAVAGGLGVAIPDKDEGE